MTTIPTATPSGAAFAVLALVQASLIFTITIIAVPLPLIGAEFGLGPSDLVLLQVAYGLPYSGLLLFGGRLTDRHGGSRILGIGLALFALTSAGAGLAPEFWVLVAMRGLQGVAAGLCAPAAVAVVHALCPEPAAFGRAMARWGGISVLGAAAGTVLSGIVTNWISWRWMFGVPVAIGVIALCLMPILPRAVALARPRYDLAGAVLLLLGIGIASHGLVMGGGEGWSAALLGAVLLIGFALHERRVADPLLPPDFLRHRGRQLGALGILLAAASMALATFIPSLYLQQALGWTPLATALAMVPYLIVLIFGSGPATWLVMRMGAMRTNAAGLVLAAVGLVLLSGLGPDFPRQLLPGLILLPAGTSLIFAASSVLLTRDVDPARMGLAGGVMNTAMELGPTAGFAAYMALAAIRAEVVAGYGLAFLAAAISFVLAAALCLVAERRR